MINLKIKIFEIEENIEVYVIDEHNFKYYILIGLHMITKFKLIQNEDLKITQKINLKIENEETIATNIKINNKEEKKNR